MQLPQSQAFLASSGTLLFNVTVAWFLHALDTLRGRTIVREFERAAEESGFPYEPRITWAQPGMFEEITLNKVRAWSKENLDGKVLYMHTKGAFTVHPANEDWRMSMESRLLGPWRVRLEDLDAVDAVGMHWITPQQFSQRGVDASFFAGNFWWARADYLAQLNPISPLELATRYAAESWIGMKNPRVKDLAPGWPVYLFSCKRA